MRGWRWA